MEERDVEECKKYCENKTSIHPNLNLNRTPDSIVCLDAKDNHLLGYSTGFQIDGHTIAENEKIIFSLLSYFCQISENSPVFFVSLSHYPSLYEQSIHLGFINLKNMFWMVKDGLLEIPSKSIYLPAI